MQTSSWFVHDERYFEAITTLTAVIQFQLAQDAYR